MKRFKNILYVNESTADQASAIARAAVLAENHQADLTILDVIPPEASPVDAGLHSGDAISTGLQADMAVDRRSALDSLIQDYLKKPGIRQAERVGKTYLEVIRAVLRNAYDLVIKPAENPTWTHRLFGSDDLHLLRKCPCPVWLMKPPEKPNYSSIVAAVDLGTQDPFSSDDDLNREILELAASLALSDFASLHIVHAWEAFGEATLLSRGSGSAEGVTDYVDKKREHHRKGLQRLAEDLRGWIGADLYDYLSPTFHLPKGPARRVIAPLAAELQADLVVMGTVARTGISGLIIGNTAETILDQLASSVLAVKPPGFKTPVKMDA